MNAPDPSASESPYRDLPSVDRLLADARVAALVPDHGHEAVAGLGKACAAETGNRVGDGDIARDWSANGRLLGMYGGGLRRRVSRRS